MRNVLVNLFFDMLEVNIVAAVLILLLCLFAGNLRKRYGAGWMKMVWVLLAVRLLIPYNFSLVPLAGISFGNINVPDRLELKQDALPTQTAVASSAEAGYTNAPASTDNSVSKNESDGKGQANVSQNNIKQSQNIDKPFVQQDMTDKGVLEEQAYANILKENKRFSYVEVIACIWIFGIFVSLCCTVFSYFAFSLRCRKNSYRVTDAGFISAVSLTESHIPVFQSGQISSPMLIGFIHPKLVLPAARKQWKTAELELIIEHEICHYQKRDLLLKILMVLVLCVNWMNPAVYLMKKQFFYDMELACDEAILRGRDLEARELYARTMLSFAGNRTSAFSSSFFENKKQMKGRIDNIFDLGAKKKGSAGAVILCIAIPIMGLAVSCGYEQADPDSDRSGAVMDGTITEIDRVDSDLVSDLDSDQEKTQTTFDYNHAYNNIIRVYKNDIYLAKEDGIYYIKDGQGEGELLYPDSYRQLRSGMEIDQNFLYFCGSAPRDGEYAAAIYRMDLDTHEVVDVLAAIGQEFESLCNISIYEGKLYVADAYGSRIGFELDPDGGIGRQLDEKADNFLYREYNDYQELVWKDAEFASEEYWNLEKQLEEMYVATIDVAACKKLLNGKQIVSKYNGESSRSYYLEKEDGMREYLFDSAAYPRIITKDGIYYHDEIKRLWYVDYETKQPRLFYQNPSRKSYDISMINYDADYIYAMQERLIGYDAGQHQVVGMYLVRIPRAGGDAERVCKIEDPPFHGSGWHGSCAVYSDWMYLEQIGFVTLDPDANGMQKANSEEPCEDAVEMRKTAEDFAAAYFENDETVLKSLLSKDFAGTAELYAYPENAPQIEEKYLAGLPDDNIETGVSCWLSYEFSGHVEADGSLVYLSMLVTKTQEGFRIRWYGLEQ